MVGQSNLPQSRFPLLPRLIETISELTGPDLLEWKSHAVGILISTLNLEE